MPLCWHQGLFPMLPELFSHNHRAGTLMGGEHKHLGNLHMGRRFGGVEGNIGYVIAGERLDSFVDVVGSVVVAVEAGFILVTLRAVSATSMRSPSVIVFTAALVAQ